MNFSSRDRLLSERARLSAADRDLTHRAAAAALTKEMKVARETVQAIQRRWRTAQHAAIENLDDDDVRNIVFAMRVPWQERVIQSTSTDGSPSISGLLVFYDPERSAGFQTMLANHEFPVSLRSDCFLYMDVEGLRSTRPYLWLGEPMPSLGPGPDTEKATETGTAARHSRNNQGEPGGILPSRARRM
ncbi:conserved hypothetical protein [Talaromyces stipitatus ATCC 10500]|uniref:Uncharacterized protein n=1 Tax=Talaromyces stipitatus (strain ATCC 10500 / CBS 375.48 / QM 6759 / NRRL 1006) TaxID=441959 RepID=B8MJM1_TALSN|nr:uncharacterized protein TSTA_046730 [Talaromyces stipitatus ATCC 10500]EED15221.1 conserved hypothetical protein [Talaromyces stipitatus ATCC 10500]